MRDEALRLSKSGSQCHHHAVIPFLCLARDVSGHKYSHALLQSATAKVMAIHGPLLGPVALCAQVLNAAYPPRAQAAPRSEAPECQHSSLRRTPPRTLAVEHFVVGYPNARLPVACQPRAFRDIASYTLSPALAVRVRRRTA